MAAMWSASKACLRPNVYASPPSARMVGWPAATASSSPQPAMCRSPTPPKNPARRLRSSVSKESRKTANITGALRAPGWRPRSEPNAYCDLVATGDSTDDSSRYPSEMDLDQLPPQVRSVLGALAHAVSTREPAIHAKVEQLRTDHPNYTNHQLALDLIRSAQRPGGSHTPARGTDEVERQLMVGVVRVISPQLLDLGVDRGFSGADGVRECPEDRPHLRRKLIEVHFRRVPRGVVG